MKWNAGETWARVNLVSSQPSSQTFYLSLSKNKDTRQNRQKALLRQARSPPSPRSNELHSKAYLKGPLAVAERADVSGCELFDYGLAGELLLHHLACISDKQNATNQHQMSSSSKAFQ